MIEESALILSIDPSFDHQTQSVATLEIVRRTACGLCGQKRGCGNALWGKLFAHKASAFKAKNSINAKVGQQVIVGINEQALLKSAFFLYLVPLVIGLYLGKRVYIWKTILRHASTRNSQVGR